MDLPSYKYPGLDSIRAVLTTLGDTWVNLRRVLTLTGLKEWRVRSALAFLVSLGIVERVKRGRRLFFYRLGERRDLLESFLRNEIFFWVMWSLLVGLPIRKGPWVEFGVKFAMEMGLVTERGLTERGRREVLAAAIERAFFEIADAGEVVPLSKVSEVLEGWGFSKTEFRKSVLGAVSHLRDARIVRFSERASGDYLEIHGLTISAAHNIR